WTCGKRMLSRGPAQLGRGWRLDQMQTPADPALRRLAVQPKKAAAGAGGGSRGMARRRSGALGVSVLAATGVLIAGCGAADPDTSYPSGLEGRGVEGKLFGDDGVSIGSI